MRKILSSLVIVFYILNSILSIATAVTTDGRSSPWTREKAMHLAEITLFNADKPTIDALFSAGSASAAVNLIFPDAVGPSRTEFNSVITNYTGSGFNWGDANHTTRLYQLEYAADPYEGKRKLFSLFEDIFSVNRDTERDITYKDVHELHELLFNNMLGNYQTLVKKVLNNNGTPGDYAAGKFLDLFNQKEPSNPNENFARELLQLFLMNEYKPFESKDNSDTRNYEESDVKSLSRLLTGFKSDAITHQISFDPLSHFSGSTLAFLSGSLQVSFPYHNSASGTIDPIAILTPVNGNNGLQDNVIEYIFAQRSDAIALFLADRIARFYISDTPSRAELDTIAQIIKSNNFEILPSIKSILVLDMVYSDTSMNSIRYKNPLELNIGTIRMLRNNVLSSIVGDPNVYDANLLRRLGWTPYFPGSIFGRDGFDDSLKWSSTSTQSAWMTASNYFTYRMTGTGVLDFLSILGSQKKEITTGNISVMTHANNSYTGSMIVMGGSLELGNPIASVVEVSALSVREPSIEEQILANGYPLDPIESILGGENLELFKSEIYEWNIVDVLGIPEVTTETIVPSTVPVTPVPDTILPPSDPLLPKDGIDTASGKLDTVNPPIDTASGVLDMLTPPTDSGAIIGIPEAVVGTTDDILPEISTGEIVLLSSSSVDIQETGAVVQPDESTGVLVDPILPPVVDTVIVPSVESGSVDSGSGANTGTTSSGEIVLPEATPDTLISTNAVAISTGSVTFPLFKIVTDLGTITVSGGTYNADTHILLIHSGFIMQGGSGTQILSGSILFDPTSKIVADTIQPNEIIDTYENYLYGEKRLQADVRSTLVDFLTKDQSGALMPVAPTNAVYFNKYIRGLLSILLSQPEYVLLHGYDKATVIDDSEQHFLDNITGKLFFVELYGGNDYMTSIIPKDEYDTYQSYRTNQTGSIAITGTGLVDIGDFYMNSALAYSSTGGVGFKDLYDKGYLKIFNRVGGYRHSSDHDAAAKQITSYDSSTSLSAEGAFGHMVKKEFESSHTISLGSKLPNIYRAGHFVNLGGSVILSNPLDQGGQLKSHMDTMVKITLARSFPGNTRNLFKDAGRISEIGKTSVSQGGPGGASGDMNSVFRFAKVLMNNNIGRSFYMGGYGGYDSHGNQFNGLNKNLNFVSSAVTNFFNEVKDTEDVTIVIFSEFGRTNKTNGDLGTDHGDGGGMYVITSNANLRNMLQAGTYGNMSIKNAKSNSLGVGVDYRSVYGSIFKSLYNLDGSTYFGTGVDIMNDISLAPNTISLLNYSYQPSGQSLLMNVELTVSGSNFNPGKAGYTRLLSGTGLMNLKSTRLNDKVTSDGYKYTFQINPNSQPYYSIETFSNQYALTSFSGTLSGATRPLLMGGAVREISQVKTSILPAFGSTPAPSKLSGTGLILESTGSHILSIADNTQIKIHFGSGFTNVTDLTTLTGSTTWRGGFILGEKMDKNLFIPMSARILSDNKTLLKQNITHLFKIGADVRGVGMKLNQPVGIEFVGLPQGESYRAVSSQDGITWDDVEMPGKVYISSATGSVLVNTDHFSYFALVSANAVEVPPSCTISINPTSVTNGGTALLSWSLLNTLTGTLNPGATVLGSSGSFLITPPSNATTPYTIAVTNTAGSNSCTASVTASVIVVPPPVVQPPSCTISINPTSVTNGGTALLTWSLFNTVTGSLNPGNIILGSSGSLTITPPSNATTPYTIAVSNSAGSNSCTASVTASSNFTEFSAPATLANFTGKNITVGVGKDFPTLSGAIASAVSGDKIYIDAGVYASDYSVFTGKNIAIIGLGSGAELKKVAPIPNQKAILVSNMSNTYIENIIFSDADVPDLNGAGIRYEGGTLTINNSTFQNNENGILGGATPVGQGKIWINNSRFLSNGRNSTGFTHAIYIGEIDSFEIKNSLVSGTSVGHHVKSRARSNTIENNILDDAGKDSSYNIDLPNGGGGVVRGNTLIQSVLSPNRTMLSYSAEKSPPNPGSLLVENNLFQSSGATAIGVNNMGTNQVILRNNTFINVSTKFTGSNIIIDDGNSPPTCTVSINPTSITNGGTALLSWSLFNTVTGSLNPGNTIVGASGSLTITPPSNATTLYTIAVANGLGTGSCATSVTTTPVVIPPPVVLPPICTISINPSSVTNGGTALLSWSLLNTLTGTLNPGATVLGSSGSFLITPPSNATTPYTISVTNTAGSSACTASVTASAVIVPPVPNPIIITGPGGGGGGSSPIIRPIDSCLGGDTSGNYYDGICSNSGMPVVQPIVTVPTEPIVGVAYIPDSLGQLVADLEGYDAKFVDASTEQRIRGIALEIWRKNSQNPRTKLASTRASLDSIAEIEQGSSNRAVETSLSRVASILEQFMENTVTVMETDPEEPVSTITPSTEIIPRILRNAAYRYIQADHSVTLRKTAAVAPTNIIGYLSRNAGIQVIQEESNGWSRVLRDGVEGYIKSIYLREGNSADILRNGGSITGNEIRGYITAKQSGYVRKSPSLLARISAVVYHNESVIILDSLSHWYEILTESGTRGYIRKELVKLLDPYSN